LGAPPAAGRGLRPPTEQPADPVDGLVGGGQLLGGLQGDLAAEVPLGRLAVGPEAALHPLGERQVDVEVDGTHGASVPGGTRLHRTASPARTRARNPYAGGVNRFEDAIAREL